LLYYFGAIRDDNNHDLLDGETTQELVDSPAKAGTRVIVEQIDRDEAASIRASRGYGSGASELRTMQRLVVIVDQLEESRRLIQDGSVSHLRMALLLLDNAAEVLMYRTVVNLLQHHEWESRLLDRAREVMPAEKLVEFQKEFNIRPLSAKERKALLHDYAAKVDRLVSDEAKLPKAVGEVLKAIHRYRNEAYHRDKIRKETLRSAVIVLYDVAVELLTRLPGWSVGYSSGDDWTSFCQRYGFKGPFDLMHRGGLDKIAASLRTGVNLTTRELGEGLAQHLKERLDEMERAIAFVADNSVGGLTPQQELKRIQFWAEHDVVPHDANDSRLRSYVARFSEEDIQRWRAASAALAQHTDRLDLFSAFARIELEIEELEEMVHEVASLLDQAIQFEVDRRRGK